MFHVPCLNKENIMGICPHWSQSNHFFGLIKDTYVKWLVQKKLHRLRGSGRWPSWSSAVRMKASLFFMVKHQPSAVSNSQCTEIARYFMEIATDWVLLLPWTLNSEMTLEPLRKMNCYHEHWTIEQLNDYWINHSYIELPWVLNMYNQ